MISVFFSFILSCLCLLSLSFFWTRNERAPSGVTSEATQHCCENFCHNIPYYDEKLKEDQGKETQVAGQLSNKMKQTVTKQWTNATDILHSVQTKNKLLLCVPSSPLGTQRDFHVNALCVEDPSPPSTIDANHRRHRRHQATKPPTTPSTPSKPPPSTPSKPSTPPLDATQAIVAPTTPAFFIVYLIFNLNERTAYTALRHHPSQ